VTDQKSLWKFHRSLTRPHFAKEITNDISHFASHVSKVIKYLDQSSEKNKAIDVQELFSMMTMDVGTELFFGTCIGHLDELLTGKGALIGGVTAEEFVQAFTRSLQHGMQRGKRSFWEIREKVFGNKNDVNMKVIEKVWDEMIQKKLDAKVEATEENYTLLDHLLSQTQDISLIKDELLNILLAARDTTANLLTTLM
jgi:cytochrome P450